MNFPPNHHHRENAEFDRAKIPLQGITGFHLKNLQWVLIYYLGHSVAEFQSTKLRLKYSFIAS